MRCNRCGAENANNAVVCSACRGKIYYANTNENVNSNVVANNTNVNSTNVNNSVNTNNFTNTTDITNFFSTGNTSLNNLGQNSVSTPNVSQNNNISSSQGLGSTTNYNTAGFNQGIGSTTNYNNTGFNQGLGNTTNYNNTSSNQGIGNTTNYNNTGFNQGVDNTTNYNNTGSNQGLGNTTNYNNTSSNQGIGSTINYNNSYNQSLPNNFNSGNNQSLNVGPISGNGSSKKNNKNNKFIVAAALVVAVVIFVFVFDIPALFSGKRTIMIYMIGSDLESAYGAASADIEEIKSSGVNFDDVNILIYTGGSKKWYNGEIPSDKNAIFKVTESGLVKLEEYDKASMTDPSTLASFLNYGYDNYKSSKYSLILWDHGGGPVYGYGQDENYMGYLSLSEIRQAFEASPFKNKKLELFGFDACLMSSIEVASVVSDYADYMVSSQETEPSLGWDYGFLSKVSKKTSTVDYGKAIIDYYANFYGHTSLKGITLSLLDLSRADYVENEINNLFKDVDDNLSIDYSSVSRTRNSAKAFGKVSAYSTYDLVDLYDLVDKMPSKYMSLSDSVKEAIDSFVVYQTTDLVNTYGVSIYFPYEGKTNITSFISIYRTFNFANEYTEFISNFSSKLTGNRLNNWRLNDNVPTVTSDDTVSVEVPSDVASNYSSASYIIFEKMDNNYYMPRFKGTDVSVSGNTFSTTITRKGLVAYDSEETTYLTAVESEKGKDYVKYLIPATLQNWGDSISDNFEMAAAYIEFVVNDENPKGYISSVIPIISEDTLAPKLNYELEDWKLVQLWNFSYKIFDDNSNYTSDWESSGSMSGVEFKTEEGFELEFRDLEPGKEYYVLFSIKDSQGNQYNTNVVRVN